MSVEHAAERCRDILELGVKFDWDNAPKECVVDLAEMARAYLDLFDLTPLTEEILRATFPHYSDRWGGALIAGPLWLRKCHGNSWDVDARYENDMGEGLWDNVAENYTTVGDLRRLLSALHIDCAVVVPESEVGNG